MQGNKDNIIVNKSFEFALEKYLPRKPMKLNIGCCFVNIQKVIQIATI